VSRGREPEEWRDRKRYNCSLRASSLHQTFSEGIFGAAAGDSSLIYLPS
jgi:hypothetical protein